MTRDVVTAGNAGGAGSGCSEPEALATRSLLISLLRTTFRVYLHAEGRMADD